LQSLERDARDGVVIADRARTVAICLEEIERLDRVVRGVLALGKPPSNGQHPASLPAIVERALDVVRPQLVAQHIALEYVRPETTYYVLAHEEQLVGMLLNLLMNAAEAMPNGGTLRVNVERKITEASPLVRVIIRDTGLGVPAAARTRIFEPFFTTKPQGAGLGLATAARDAEQHQGRLTLLDDGDRGGAAFEVELPLLTGPRVSA
jgi:signal transduction histidine kinase